MATRTTSLESKILKALTEWESSAESPATLQEVMGEFGTGDKETYDALGALEDAGKVTSDGRWLTSVWFLGKAKETPAPTETVKPKRKRRTKAEMAAARAEERARLEYNTRAAESQDMVMSQASEYTDQNGNSTIPDGGWEEYTNSMVIAAETPVIASDGEPVTVPVDWDNPSAGCRELDASQGERVLGEDDMRKMILELKRENAALKAKRESETQMETATLVFHEPKNGPCPGVEIPPVPAGVHPHTWELAHDANTETARAYYTRQVEAQIAEHEETAIAEEHMREILANQDDAPPF